MKKAIIAGAAIVALAGAAVVGGAAVTGSQARKALQEAPAGWQAQWPLLKVVDQKYDKGLFGATHTLTLQLGCDAQAAAAEDAKLLVTLVQRVQHGPLPGFAGFGAAVVDTEVVVPEKARKALDELTGGKPPFTARTVVGFGGGSTTSVSMPAVKFTGPKGEQFAWQGLSGEVRQSGDTWRYDFVTPGMTMTAKDERAAFDIKLTAFRMHGELSGTGSMWLRPGKGQGELVSMEISGAGTPGERPVSPFKLALNQLKFSSDVRIEKDLISNIAKFSGNGSFNDARIDRVEMDVSLKRLHAPTYEKLVKRFLDTTAAACDMKQGVSPQVMLSQMQQDVVALLPHNPEYSLDKLAVEFDGKRGELSYSLGLAGVTEADLQLPMPALLMSKGQVKGQAKLPVAWVEKAMAKFGGPGGQAPADPAAQAEMMNVMLGKLEGEGYIQRKDDMLSSTFSFDKGVMTVNGKPVGRPPQ